MVRRAHLIQKLNSLWFGQGMGRWRMMPFIQGARLGRESSQGPGLQNLPWELLSLSVAKSRVASLKSF